MATTKKGQELIVNNYDHGGSRMYLEDVEKPTHPLKSADRDLVVDCFQDKEFSDYIEKCVREYFDL